jgi:hypothetical protein
MFRAAYRSSSGVLDSISSLWFIYQCGDRALSRLGGNWASHEISVFDVQEFHFLVDSVSYCSSYCVVVLLVVAVYLNYYVVGS